MASVRLSPYIDVKFAEPTHVVTHLGYSLTDLMSQTSSRTINHSDNAEYTSYSIGQETVTVAGQDLNRNTLWYDQASSSLSLLGRYDPLDADNTIGAGGWVPETGYESVWRNYVPDGQSIKHVHQVDVTPNILRQITLDKTVGVNQNFAIGMYRYASPPNVDVNEAAVHITFGGIWRISLYQKDPPVLSKYIDGEWCVVSEGPTLFDINKYQTILVRIVYNRIMISNGWENTQVWTYIDMNIDANSYLEETDDSTASVYKIPLMTQASGIMVHTINSPVYMMYQPIKYGTSGVFYSPWANHGYANKSEIPNGTEKIKPLVSYCRPRANGINGTGPDDGSSVSITSVMGTGSESQMWRYELTINSSTDYRYSPYVFSVFANEGNTLKPIIGMVDWNERLFATPGRVIGGSVTIDVRGSTGTVVMSNYDGALSGYSGYHRITIDAGWWMIDETTGSVTVDETNVFRIFTGYAYDPSFSKNNAGKSVVSLQLIDCSIVMKDTGARNLPPYDGACVYFAMWDICRKTGITLGPNAYGLPIMLAYQNPRNAYDYRLFATQASDVGGTPEPLDWTPDNYQCRTGQCGHVILDQGGWMNPPQHKFEDNTWLWDNLNSISDGFKRHWIFFNNWGNLIVTDPEWENNPYMNNSSVFTFRELTGPSGSVNMPDQIESLELKAPASHIRNNVVVMGYDFVGGTGLLLSVSKTDLTDGSLYNYIPWHKTAILKDPKYARNQVNILCQKNMLVQSRPRPTASWRTKGNTFVFPYDSVTIQEDTNTYGSEPILFGIGKVFSTTQSQITDPQFNTFWINSVTHDFSSAEVKEITSNWEGEWRMPANGDRMMYDPRW